MVLPTDTLLAAVPEEGWMEECSPPGVWEGLKAGKQVLGMVSAGTAVGKDIHYQQGKLS